MIVVCHETNYFERTPIEKQFVEEYGRKHGLSKTLVYDERTKVLDKLRRIIEAEYYD